MIKDGIGSESIVHQTDRYQTKINQGSNCTIFLAGTGTGKSVGTRVSTIGIDTSPFY